MSRSISPLSQAKQSLPNPDAVLLLRLRRVAALTRAIENAERVDKRPPPGVIEGGEG
jgi:hypothetical protein